MNEKKLTHPINIDISMYNMNGSFTLSAYQRMIMSMIEEHLDALQLGEKYLMKEYGISWVLLSTSIEFKRKLLPTDKLTGRTWHAGGRVPSFRRDFVFEDDFNNTVAIGATTSTLFENDTRRICLNKEKLAVVSLESHEPILPTFERKMKLSTAPEFVELRRVRPSMTDGVGHVNNTKYGDFVYDAMSNEERDRLGDVKRLDVWFNHELREGDKFEIFKSAENDTETCFYGRLRGEVRSAFDMKITYFEKEEV